MYTVLWKEADQDRWDRLETAKEVFALFEELKENPDVCVEDVWVFGPEADAFAWNGETEFCEDNDEEVDDDE